MGRIPGRLWEDRREAAQVGQEGGARVGDSAARQEMQDIKSRRDTLKSTHTATTRPRTTGLRQEPAISTTCYVAGVAAWSQKQQIPEQAGCREGAVCGGRGWLCGPWVRAEVPPFTGKNSLQNPKFTKQKHKYIYQEKVEKKKKLDLTVTSSEEQSLKRGEKKRKARSFFRCF